MTCENCVHYDVCFERSDLYWSLPIDELGKSCEKYCNEFKAKSRMVELPCAVGDVVWFITGIHCKIIKPAKIVEIIINETGISDLFVSTDNCSFENSFGTFFLNT